MNIVNIESLSVPTVTPSGIVGSTAAGRAMLTAQNAQSQYNLISGYLPETNNNGFSFKTGLSSGDNLYDVSFPVQFSGVPILSFDVESTGNNIYIANIKEISTSGFSVKFSSVIDENDVYLSVIGREPSYQEYATYNTYVALATGENVVYASGNQNISGVKNFSSIPTVNGSGIVPDADSDGKQYARKDGAWVEVVAGSAAPTALTPDANVKFGAAAGAGITDVLPAAPAAGDRAKYYIKPTGDKTLDFDTAILKPTDSGLTLPKTMTSGKTYIVLMEYNGTAWMLVSLVGGYA